MTVGGGASAEVDTGNFTLRPASCVSLCWVHIGGHIKSSLNGH